jgi:hypothetical protein
MDYSVFCGEWCQSFDGPRSVRSFPGAAVELGPRVIAECAIVEL